MGHTGRSPRGYAKIGDDVAVGRPGRGRIVLKVDMLVEHTDVPPGMTYRQAARKAVAMCVSDFAAKGVKPDSYMISLGLKRGISEKEVGELGRGLKDAEREWGVKLVGGDTNEAKELVVDCAMVGFADKVVTRGGASPGDALVVSGPFGYPPSGLKILSGRAAGAGHFAKRAKESVLMPKPSLKVGLALAPYLTSAMDSSDGLARSLHTLAGDSHVGFEVTRLPAAEGVDDFAARNGLDFRKLVLEGGEEYVIVGTVRRTLLSEARRAAEKTGGGLLEIGRATKNAGEVFLKARGRTLAIRNGGWTHLT